MCKYDEIIELLEAGAKADFETDTGYTALIMAAGVVLLLLLFFFVSFFASLSSNCCLLVCCTVGLWEMT